MDQALVMNEPVGLIAGGGRLPFLVAQGIHRAGRQVACVGVATHYDDILPTCCDRFAAISVLRMASMCRQLRRWGATQVVMVGRVRKSIMYNPVRLFRSIPDMGSVRVWYATRHDRRPDKLLTAIANELANNGVTLIDSTTYIPDQMSDEGPMTRRRPSASQSADIEFALPIVQQLGDLDIGQAIAVKDRDIIAVEAMEGTDAMIERAGKLCRKGKWTLVKLAKPNQDMRFDVPTVGLQTIEQLAANGATCLAIEAGRAILLDKPAFITAAEKAGVALVGVHVGATPPKRLSP
jgi:DUF1009 family protein